MNLKEKKEYCKDWLNANCSDGEDRYDARCDKHYMTPKDLRDLVFDLLDDLEEMIDSQKEY